MLYNKYATRHITTRFTAQVGMKSKAYNKSTASEHVKMFHTFYSVLRNESRTIPNEWS